MFKKILLLIAVILPMTAFAQKFGTVNTQAVFEAMPETTAMTNQLTASQKQFQEELQKLASEIDKLYSEFQTIAEDANTPQSIKERRMAEIQDKSQKVEQFREQASQDLARQREQLFAPISTKVLDAVKAVGQEGGYTIIFPMEEGLLLYSGSDVTDVTAAVKAKLGL